MSYDYIRNYYGIEITVNRLVRHTVTARYGTIKPEGREHRHYVKVHFHGDKHYSNCHPAELEFVAYDE
ncbi:hypothetical protein CFBP5877_18655 [Agrobacterium tumefaciens]|uniref:Uncharacterized protein n=1 Tax=Agrobacterium tumefaciens TaxID=358 RepID=A0AAE6BHH8_AGRTU|nr:hypothetical protein [Agrobacterium tumefaciens]QCL81164.1 hypothetical protein CFBP5877_18655 [Agrobacterium tumefaciens]